MTSKANNNLSISTRLSKKESGGEMRLIVEWIL